MVPNDTGWNHAACPLWDPPRTVQFLLHRSISVSSRLSSWIFSFSPFCAFHSQILLPHLTVLFHPAFQPKSWFLQHALCLHFHNPSHIPLFASHHKTQCRRHPTSPSHYVSIFNLITSPALQHLHPNHNTRRAQQVGSASSCSCAALL